MRLTAPVLLAALVTLRLAEASPRVAVVYSAWSDNSFLDEWDDELAELGWPFEKFENVKSADLLGRLSELDLVIAASVSNYENPQDMTPYREQWLQFLDGGGCLLVTDASYATALNQWVNTFGDEFALSSAHCAAHTEKTEESRAIGVADHPLMTVPNDLAPLLRRNLSAWAHPQQHGGYVALRCSGQRMGLSERSFQYLNRFNCCLDNPSWQTSGGLSSYASTQKVDFVTRLDGYS